MNGLYNDLELLHIVCLNGNGFIFYQANLHNWNCQNAVARLIFGQIA